jgi:16S rRNA (guanine527-N7)-methyltransferase
MHPARIAELLEPFLSSLSNPHHSESGRRPGEESAVLSPAQLQSISTYIDILIRWNARINLTAIRDPEQIVTRHFGESLFAARHLFPTTNSVGTAALESLPRAKPGGPAERRSAAGALAPEGSANDRRRTTSDAPTLADLGSGAGFPGIPIKLWAPDITLTLIESNQKKVTFLREIIRALTLTNVNVFPGRAQELLPGEMDQHHSSRGPGRSRQTKDPQPRPPQGFDLVTLRAVERFADVLPAAASLVSSGGRLALLIGTSQVGAAQAALPTLTWDSPLPVPMSQSRTLLVGHQH